VAGTAELASIADAGEAMPAIDGSAASPRRRVLPRNRPPRLDGDCACTGPEAGTSQRRRWLQKTSASIDCYCAFKALASGALTIGGGFHLPVSAPPLGPYRRMVTLNPPFGDGSQLASLLLPGLSFWK
jgi:hypothetical protein